MAAALRDAGVDAALGQAEAWRGALSRAAEELGAVAHLGQRAMAGWVVGSTLNSDIGRWSGAVVPASARHVWGAPYLQPCYAGGWPLIRAHVVTWWWRRPGEARLN